ncbi:PHP domain-containing protein [Enorma burkinafasonensis]|uniref:PHP domain-containing protein n=1 Tax=Enorma burkinafasonensis TaxID=2590867 RepID=UPI00119CFF35|nr:PHP domain-containing protein [Enorma burkinafasonensis]
MSDRTPPLIDCHTHTGFSDGTSTFEENVRAAAARGCRVMVASDHLTLPASMDPLCEASVAEADLPAHRAAFEAARALAAELQPALELVYGFECDWYEGCEGYVERWAAGAAVRLGSVHWLGPAGIGGATGAPAGDMAGAPHGWIDDSGDMHLWEELGADGIWRRYAATWCRACESPLAFDVMAHPDLPARFSREGWAPTGDLAPLWDEMAACARDTGRRIELSTAALRKGIGDYYPSAGLLERFVRAGVPVTFGSDAHRAQDVCHGIEEARRHAWRAGYRTFDMPHADGSWETVALG